MGGGKESERATSYLNYSCPERTQKSGIAVVKEIGKGKTPLKSEVDSLIRDYKDTRAGKEQQNTKFEENTLR